MQKTIINLCIKKDLEIICLVILVENNYDICRYSLCSSVYIGSASVSLILGYFGGTGCPPCLRLTSEHTFLRMSQWLSGQCVGHLVLMVQCRTKGPGCASGKIIIYNNILIPINLSHKCNIHESIE